MSDVFIADDFPFDSNFEDDENFRVNLNSGLFQVQGYLIPEKVNMKKFMHFKMCVIYCLGNMKVPNIKVIFYMKNFNSLMSRLILDLLSVLDTNSDRVLVEWLHDKEDEDMQEAGEEFKELVDLKFEIKAL